MRGNQGVALSQRVCRVAAPTVVRRVVHHGGTYGVELDIALAQQSIGVFLHQRRLVEETGIAVVATLDTV